MVIKAKDKTRAAQRKGALTNWKKTGRTLIKYLRFVQALNGSGRLCQEAGHQRRRSAPRVLGARGGEQPKEEKEGG